MIQKFVSHVEKQENQQQGGGDGGGNLLFSDGTDGCLFYPDAQHYPAKPVHYELRGIESCGHGGYGDSV